jgi:hypothetical protein
MPRFAPVIKTVLLMMFITFPYVDSLVLLVVYFSCTSCPRECRGEQISASCSEDIEHRDKRRDRRAEPSRQQ